MEPRMMAVLLCRNSMCVNISGRNQRQIPNDNFANQSKIDSTKILAKGPCYFSLWFLDKSLLFVKPFHVLSRGKYSGKQRGLRGRMDPRPRPRPLRPCLVITLTELFRDGRPFVFCGKGTVTMRSRHGCCKGERKSRTQGTNSVTSSLLTLSLFS